MMSLDDDSATITEARRKYVCKVCSRSFKRSEHCVRHARAHTQEKPFACRYCKRRYSRKDLVVRHERTLHAEEHAQKRLASQRKETQPENDAEAVSLSPSDEGPDSPLETGEHSDTIVVSCAPRPISLTEPNLLGSPVPSSDASGRFQIQQPLSPCHDGDILQQHSSFARSQANQDSARYSVNDTATHFATSVNILTPNTDRDQDVAGQPFVNTGYQGQDIETTEDILMDTSVPNLDFFDPFLGNTYDHFALPTLPYADDFMSPFEPTTYLNTTRGLYAALSPRNVPDSAETSHEALSSSRRDLSGMARSRPWEMTWKRRAQGSHAAITRGEAPSFDETANAHTWSDVRSRLGSSALDSFKIPSATLMQQWLHIYLDSFHVHFPFIHLPTLDFATLPSPLTLAICAVGALHRLNRLAAVALHVKAVQCLDALEVKVTDLILEQNLLRDWTRPTTKNESTMSRPLWHSHARLLSLMFATFSGDPLVVRKALQDLAILSSDYRTRLMQVKPGSFDRRTSSWNEWVERESSKRLLHMTFIFSNLISILYGVPPGFCLSQDGIVEMPDDESLWQAQTEPAWHQLVTTKRAVPPISLRDAAAAIIDGDPAEELTDLLGAWSAFGTSVAIHAVSVQIWQFNQGTMFGETRNSQGARDNVKNSILAKKIQTALNRCRDLLTEIHNEPSCWNNNIDSPVLFNTFAILRVSFTRAFTNVGLANREMLLYETSDAIVSAIYDYINIPQERGDFITKSVARSFEGLIIPFQSSPLLIRKTAALSWSIEHALAGWDSGLLVTKWLFAIEELQRADTQITEAEEELLGKVRLLIEAEEYDGKHTLLASSLARLWAGFYDDTWVWGVTPRIGWVFRELANAYEAASAFRAEDL